MDNQITKLLQEHKSRLEKKRLDEVTERTKSTLTGAGLGMLANAAVRAASKGKINLGNANSGLIGAVIGHGLNKSGNSTKRREDLVKHKKIAELKGDKESAQKWHGKIAAHDYEFAKKRSKKIANKNERLEEKRLNEKDSHFKNRLMAPSTKRFTGTALGGALGGLAGHAVRIKFKGHELPTSLIGHGVGMLAGNLISRAAQSKESRKKDLEKKLDYYKSKKDTKGINKYKTKLSKEFPSKKK